MLYYGVNMSTQETLRPYDYSRTLLNHIFDPQEIAGTTQALAALRKGSATKNERHYLLEPSPLIVNPWVLNLSKGGFPGIPLPHSSPHLLNHIQTLEEFGKRTSRFRWAQFFNIITGTSQLPIQTPNRIDTTPSIDELRAILKTGVENGVLEVDYDVHSKGYKSDLDPEISPFSFLVNMVKTGILPTVKYAQLEDA